MRFMRFIRSWMRKQAKRVLNTYDCLGQNWRLLVSWVMFVVTIMRVTGEEFVENFKRLFLLIHWIQVFGLLLNKAPQIWHFNFSLRLLTWRPCRSWRGQQGLQQCPQAKMHFEKMKQERYDLFMHCVSSMSQTPLMASTRTWPGTSWLR